MRLKTSVSLLNMNKIKKNFVVGVLALSMMAVVAVPTGLQAQNVNGEVQTTQKIVETLEANTAVLLQSNSPVSGIPSGFRFNTNLREGVRGSEVRYLQILLNTDPATGVATSGAGSPGNETDYFGPRTNAAVIRFQEKYTGEVLAPYGLARGTGFVGTTTRAKLNSILAEGVTPVDPTPPPVDDNLSAVLEQLQKLAEALAQLRARLDDIDEGITPPVDGEEAEIVASRLSTPRNVKLGSLQEKEVTAFEIESKEGASTIRRVDLIFDDSNVSRTNIERALESVSLVVDGEVMGSYSIVRNSIDRNNLSIRISGLEIEIPANETKSVYVRISTDEHQQSGVVGLRIPNDGIRVVDGSGLNQYVGGFDLRSFELTEREIAQISITESDDTPEERIVVLEEDDPTKDVELLHFNLEVEDGDVELIDLLVKITLTFSDDLNQAGFAGEFSDIITDVRVYYDGTLLDGETSDEALGSNTSKEFEILFSGLDLVLEEGEYEFMVEVDFSDLEKEYEGLEVSASVDAEDIEADDLFDFESLETSDLSGVAEGEIQYLYTVAPSLTVTETEIEYVRKDDYDTVVGSIMFELEALNGDVYLEKATTGDNLEFAVLRWTGSKDLDGSNGNLVLNLGHIYTDAKSSGGYFVVEEGKTEEFEIYFEISSRADSPGDFGTDRGRVEVESFTWGNKDNLDAYEWTGTFIEDFRTGRITIRE